MARKTVEPRDPEQKAKRKPRAKKPPKTILEAITAEIKVFVDQENLIEEAKEGMKAQCPFCLAKHDITKSTVLIKGGMKCPTCGKWFLVRIHADRERYTRGLGTTAGGNDTLDIADDTADLLRGLDLDTLYNTVAMHLEECGKDAMSRSFMKGYGKNTPWDMDTIHAYLHNRYWERNPGMQRMNLGNVLRAAMKNRSSINIKGQ